MASQIFDRFYKVVEQVQQDALLRMGSEYKDCDFPCKELEYFLKIDGTTDLSKWQEKKFTSLLE